MFDEAPRVIVMVPYTRWGFLKGQSREGFAPYPYGRIVEEGVDLLSKVFVSNLIYECDQSFVQVNLLSLGAWGNKVGLYAFGIL